MTQADYDPIEEEVQRRLTERALLRIREGGHPLLRDLAEGVLRGDMTLEALTRSSVAAPALQAATVRYLEWQKGLSPAEHEALVNQVSARLEQMRQEVGAETESGRA